MEKGLREICHPKQWRTLSADMLSDSGYPVYGANGIIGYYTAYNHEEPTILITCRGATCGTINICKPFSYVNGNAMALDDLSKDIEIQYLYYFLLARGLSDVITGSAQPQIVKQSLTKVKVIYPPLDEQRKIAAVLDKVSDLIAKRRQQLDKLDTLVKARFVEMFGDTLLNSMEWPECRLDLMAEIVSGITKGRKIKDTELFEVPYMAVSNVKDGYIDWTTVKTIMATQAEINQYRLLPLDVLMTEGGDPDKLGRGAIIYRPPDNCIHQNHIFRVRLNKAVLSPVYLEQYLQQQRAKRYFWRCAKQTTGIASINMKQLSALPILTPPLAVQVKYAAFIEQVNQSKISIQKSCKQLDILKKALLQKYFE